MKLEGDHAFSALKRLLAGESSSTWTSPSHPAFERLRKAWLDPSGRSPIELALLLRQALLHETGRRQGLPATTSLAPSSPLQAFDAWAGVGLDAQKLDGGWLVAAQVWAPDWLSGSAPSGVDSAAATERPRADADDHIVRPGIGNHDIDGFDRRVLRAGDDSANGVWHADLLG